MRKTDGTGERRRGIGQNGRSGVGLLAGLALATALVGPVAPGRASASEISPAQLGEAHGDTLRVELAMIRAAAAQGNQMLAAARAQADAAGADALGAWRGFLPRIQIGEYFMRTDNALSSFGFKLNERQVNPQTDFGPAALNDPPISELYTTRLLIEQPVFNGGMSLYGKLAADDAAAAARLEAEHAAAQTDFQAVQAYYGLVLARAYEDVVRKAIDAARAHVRQARAMVEAEMATPADQMQAEVQLSQLEQRLIQVRSQVRVAGENIELLTGLQTDLVIVPADELTAPQELQMPSPDTVGSYAARADVRAGGKKAEAAGGMVGVARGAMLPHVNISAERDYYGGEIFPDQARSWTFGVYGTWDIFTGLQNIGALRKARAQERAAEHMRRFSHRQARLRATEAWLDLQSALDRVVVARRAVVSARESLRILDSQYREGIASMVDLLDTQAAATQAEGNLVQAMHDYHVSLARVEFTGAPVDIAGEESE